ncbi:SprB repeat-containing protein [Ekhidna sp.]|uniref:SprB repeat-containing protein n=1 Tax=Ekhidna sp. TaxID=2608089 RepID=UPI0035164D6D
MKNLSLLLLLTSLLIYVGCSNNSEEDLEVDCSQSDLSVSITATTEPTCETTGSITVSGSGGIAPYTYSLDGVIFQSSSEFTGLVAGALTIHVMDSDGCTAKLNSTLNTDGGLVVSLSSTSSDCLSATGSIEVTASGGDETFTYSLDGGTAQSESTFSSVSSGDHEVTVTDGAGCSATKSVYVNSGVSLINDIMPLLASNCTSGAGAACHDGSNGSDRNWTVKNNVINKAQNIKARTQSGNMPRAGSGQSLTQAEIDMIACWVDDGAKDN